MTTSNRDRKVFMVGGGIGCMAAAAFLIRDAGVPGGNITIYEALPLLGGSLDGAGNPQDGYSLRGGRMLTTDNYECTWGLFKSIPSLRDPSKTVFEETVEFNERIKSHSRARLVDRQPRHRRRVLHGLHHERPAGARSHRRGQRGEARREPHHRLVVAAVLHNQILVHVGRPRSHFSHGTARWSSSAICTGS